MLIFYFRLETRKYLHFYKNLDSHLIFNLYLFFMTFIFGLYYNFFRNLWDNNPKNLLIIILITLFFSLMLISIQSTVTFKFDMLLPHNAYFISKDDFSFLYYTSSWRLNVFLFSIMKMILTAFKFSFFVSNVMFFYILEHNFSIINYFIILFVLFLSFFEIFLLAALIKFIIEEIVEINRSFWREKNYYMLNKLFEATIFISILGALYFSGSYANYLVSFSLVQIIHNFWYLPLFNSINILLLNISHSYSNTFYFESLFSIFIYLSILLIPVFYFYTRYDPLLHMTENEHFLKFVYNSPANYFMKIPFEKLKFTTLGEFFKKYPSFYELNLMLKLNLKLFSKSRYFLPSIAYPIILFFILQYFSSLFPVLILIYFFEQLSFISLFYSSDIQIDQLNLVSDKFIRKLSKMLIICVFILFQLTPLFFVMKIQDYLIIYYLLISLVVILGSLIYYIK